PGVRQGPPGAGAPLNGLTSVESSLFDEGLQRAIQLEAVCDDCADLTLGSFTDPAKANFVTQTNSTPPDWECVLIATNVSPVITTRRSAVRAASWSRIRRMLRTGSARLKTRCSTLSRTAKARPTRFHHSSNSTGRFAR